jgi:hypothetical protein
VIVAESSIKKMPPYYLPFVIEILIDPFWITRLGFLVYAVFRQDAPPQDVGSTFEDLGAAWQWRCQVFGGSNPSPPRMLGYYPMPYTINIKAIYRSIYCVRTGLDDVVRGLEGQPVLN